MGWSSRVTSISLEMVLPGVVGYWIDQRTGTGFLFLVLGTVLGFSVGMWSLVKLANSSSGNDNSSQDGKR